VLRELGYAQHKIDALRGEKVIGSEPAAKAA
jgi:hypothetical protein